MMLGVCWVNLSKLQLEALKQAGSKAVWLDRQASVEKQQQMIAPLLENLRPPHLCHSSQLPRCHQIGFESH